MRFMQIRVFLPCFLLAISVPAYAVDGVLEINQACAVNTGCFSGDTADFPVTISALGSYRLTSNLIVPDTKSAITAGVGDVTIDLNGFMIEAQTRSTEIGISGGSRVTVRNGSIREFFTGIQLVSNSLVERVIVTRMTQHGISVSKASIVKDSQVLAIGEDGITGRGGCVIIGNTIEGVGEIGINTFSSTILGNTVLSFGEGGAVWSAGIGCGGPCRVSENVIDGGLGLASPSTGFSLSLSETLGGTTGYNNNTIRAGTLGTVSGGVDAGGNICGVTLGCP
jgi:hypothetical protein